MDSSSKGEVVSPIPVVNGDYWFDLISSSKYGEITYQVLIRISDLEPEISDSNSKNHPWMENAVVYQLSPYNFSTQGGFLGIITKLNELAELDVNTLYLQPFYETSRKGQGYDIVDYFKVRSEYGGEDALLQLSLKAKSLGMRVLFDLVLNYSSIEHPYAKGKIRDSERSHYQGMLSLKN